MAIPLVVIEGKILLPDGTAPASGTITAKLSHPGSVLDGGDSQITVDEVHCHLEPGGVIPATFALVPNDAITPAGTHYAAEIRTQAVAGGVWRKNVLRLQLASAPSPIDIGAVPRPNEVPGLAIAVGYVNLQSALPRYTTATCPDPATMLGKLVRVKDPGSAEEVRLSLETSSGGSEWITIAIASS